jgi:hypothetical protein
MMLSGVFVFVRRSIVVFVVVFVVVVFCLLFLLLFFFYLCNFIKSELNGNNFKQLYFDLNQYILINAQTCK